MTENRCIEVLKKMKHMFTETCAKIDENTALDMAVEAIKENQQYRAIGTVEEFKALKEKNEPKKPILNNPKINEFYIKEAKLCPACHSYINNYSGDYCRDCGQKLDWSE